jgi:hypothetical protein
MDYRKFLGRREELVLPYFDGLRVDAPGRRLRLSERLQRGFWRFEITGRNAKPLERVTAPDLETFPARRGHYASGYLFESGSTAAALEFIDTTAPAELTPCTARELPGGYLLFAGSEFESEAEDAARRALEDENRISHISGIGATLRSAYAYALVVRVGRGINVPVVPAEVRSRALALAQGGRTAALELLGTLSERRELERIRLAAHDAVVRSRQPQRRQSERSLFDRISDSLDGAGATLLDARMVEAGVDVTWRFSGQRLISLVEADGLRVIDAGFCLSGQDDLVTLDSLPSVVREALDTDALNITRW